MHEASQNDIDQSFTELRARGVGEPMTLVAEVNSKADETPREKELREALEAIRDSCFHSAQTVRHMARLALGGAHSPTTAEAAQRDGKRIADLERTLAFYASPKTYHGATATVANAKDLPPPAIAADLGGRAREALRQPREASDPVIAPTPSVARFSPFVWPNECGNTVPEALRYLSGHDRPREGESNFNTVHLLQLAHEIESVARRSLYVIATEPRKTAVSGTPDARAQFTESMLAAKTGVLANV